jgi:hypothetical protein
MNTDTMSIYGDYYLKRAIVTMQGLGANQPADAIYPLNIAEADGKPMNGDQKYVMHFNKEELPPVEAFWSVTMYEAEGYQAEKVTKWLSAPSKGALGVTMRLYAPKSVELDGSWNPPAVKRVE